MIRAVNTGQMDVSHLLNTIVPDVRHHLGHHTADKLYQYKARVGSELAQYRDLRQKVRPILVQHRDAHFPPR